MEALDALAVAERDILALSTARSRQRRSASRRKRLACLALPVRQGPDCGVERSTVHRRTGLSNSQRREGLCDGIFLVD